MHPSVLGDRFCLRRRCHSRPPLRLAEEEAQFISEIRNVRESGDLRLWVEVARCSRHIGQLKTAQSSHLPEALVGALDFSESARAQAHCRAQAGHRLLSAPDVDPGMLNLR